MADSHRPRVEDLLRLYHLNSSLVPGQVVPGARDVDRRVDARHTLAGARRTSLLGRDDDIPMPLGRAMVMRTSRRSFAAGSLSNECAGRILHLGCGVLGTREDAEPGALQRPAPSAGGVYPLELYVATRAVDGVPDGLHHYDARAHELEMLDGEEALDRLAGTVLQQEILGGANLVVIVTAVFERTTWSYGLRGYRHVLLEVGHTAQNLCLAAVGQGLGAVCLGGFYDAEVNRVLRLRPDVEDALYIVAIGG